MTTTIKSVILTTGSILLILSQISCSFGSSASKSGHSLFPGELEPSLVSKVMRAQAIQLQKQAELNDKMAEMNAPLNQAIKEARADCAAKGFQLEGEGPLKGKGKLMPNGNQVACVQKPPAPAAPTPAAPTVNPAPVPTTVKK